MIFVGKVLGASGVPRFFRVESASTSAARAILNSRFGSTASVEIVSTPEFLLETDPDFLELLQRSQLGDLNAFVKTLAIVVARDEPDDKEEPGSDPEETEPSNGITDLPIDVQSFPFASFQNAVAELGLDPEGVLGSTVGERFDTLAPVARIGSLTGSIDPIGQDPGALQLFFRDRFGDLDIAAETFQDLLARSVGGDLDAEQLLTFQSLQNPDVATSRGRGNAADVFRLAKAAAADRFGSFVGSRLLPSNARLFRELERQLAESNPDINFLEFARQQNLLPV